MKRTFALLAAWIFTLGTQAQTTWTLDETVLTEYDLVSGVNIPWELLWGPDDMLWCTTRHGDVLRIDPLTGAFEIVLEINVFGGSGEPGLLGMAMHPNWEVTPQVFLVYTSGTTWSNAEERLSVFDWNGTSLTNEQVLHTVDAGGIHNGSRLLVLPDNTLLMSTGDVGDGGISSQSDFSDNGKMLRFNLDGSIPTDNPNPSSYVYSKGHRNSQGLCLGPNGIVYSSEHGQSNWDELNIIEPGRNYGWPAVEGECNTTNEQAFCEANDVAEPLKTWSPCVAVNGIEFYNHPAIPEWQGSILMAVLGGLSGQYERLSVLHMSEDGLLVESEEQHFAAFNQRVRDVAINPYTGSVYLAFNGPQYPGSGPNLIKEFRPSEPSGVNTWPEVRGVDVFPNPAQERITLKVGEAWANRAFEIWDSYGRLFTKGTLSHNTLLDATDWPAGSYVLTASARQGQRLTRLILVE